MNHAQANRRISVLFSHLDSKQDKPVALEQHNAKSITSTEREGGEEIVERESFDIVIVGAGIAGCALAHALAAIPSASGRQGGWKILVIERDLRPPNRIVGELLQPGGLCALKALGLQHCVEGIDAVMVKGYAVMSGARSEHSILLPYPEERQKPRQEGHEQQSEVCGWSFHHGAFVNNLRQAARSNPNVEMREGAVTKLLRGAPGVDGQHRVTGICYKSKSGATKEVLAPLTFVCDGGASRFRSELTDQVSSANSRFVGVIVDGCPLEFSNHGHVFLVEPAPVLCYQISSTETRMLIDIPDGTPGTSAKELKNFLITKTAPQLPSKVSEALIEAINKGAAIRSMPNSKLHPNPGPWPDGVVLLGDSFNSRHPLTGGGMSVAFWDAVMLREELAAAGADLRNRRALQMALCAWHRRRLGLASTVNTLSWCLYTLFAAPKESSLAPMREACLGYFKLGGICVSGPINLLSIMNPNPVVLMSHFFAVALYGVAREMWPVPWPWRVWRAAKIWAAACSVFAPVAHGEHLFALSYPYFPRVALRDRLAAAGH